jgi:uncharacterized membrane protein YoaK (UPF0700 family)
MEQEQVSDSFALGTILSFAGGFLDAYTYIARGGVFANAQTGNIVLLGLHAAKGNWREAFYYVFPILAFISGIHIAELIRDRLKGRMKGLFHWRQIILCVEIGTLAANVFMERAAIFTCGILLAAFAGMTRRGEAG